MDDSAIVAVAIVRIVAMPTRFTNVCRMMRAGIAAHGKYLLVLLSRWYVE